MANQQTKTVNPVGWGYLEDALDECERKRLIGNLGAFLNQGKLQPQSAPGPEDIRLSEARLEPPASLRDCVTADHHSRLLHAVGRSYRDLATLRSDTVIPAPDVVASPGTDAQLERVCEWAQAKGYALIPFGGGSSVVGGVNPENLDAFDGVVTLNLQGMDRVTEVSTVDQLVHAEAGILGPALDAALKPHGLAVRHFPQSYFHSSLGGWVATRGAGHFSTLRAKIEDRVRNMTVLLPDGRRVETRAVPASSVGPDPNRLWCGSEGALGIITSVSLRTVPIPEIRAGGGIVFDDFESALAAARQILQAGLWPTQLRMLDPFEHMMSAAMTGRGAQDALMIIDFESATEPMDGLLERAKKIAADHGGRPQQKAKGGGSVEGWRDTFFRQPYLRDVLLDYAVIADTFETAVPWSALPDFYHEVRGATLDAMIETCGAGGVTCRTTHAYPDGVSLYFSFYGQGRHGALVEQWQAIKQAASDAVMAHGGTISHHHAMGRDHKPWAKQELPQAFRAAIRAAKRELDPKGIMNPGLWFED